MFFFDLCLNQQFSKQWRRWCFETLPCSLWRHCNAFDSSDPVFCSCFDSSDPVTTMLGHNTAHDWELRCVGVCDIVSWWDNYANPVYGVATICHQVRWLRWGHPSLFHTATYLLIWYNMFCVRDISYRLIWMEFINMFSVYAQSGTHSRFNW